MSHHVLSNRVFLRRIIREYYSRKPLEEPLYIHRREIALQSLEDNVYIRHLSFPSMTRLYEYILNKKTPLHLYYSSAYYEDPGNDKMEHKGWIGSDLMFDIDSDKYSGCDKVLSLCIEENIVYQDKISTCPNGGEPIQYPIITRECLERAFYDVVKLYLILHDELGFKDIRIYFSGNRGFHVKVYDEQVLKLSRDERREIASYIMLENIDVEKLFPIVKKKYVLLGSSEWGVRKRLLRIIEEAGFEYDRVGEYVKIPYEEFSTLLEELSVKLDPVVTMDVSRLSRFGFSLNCKSGLMVYPIDIDRIDGVDFEKFNPWNGKLIVKPLIDAKLPVFDREVKLKRGERVELEAWIGLYLVFKNVVEVINDRDFGVKSCMTCS